MHAPQPVAVVALAFHPVAVDPLAFLPRDRRHGSADVAGVEVAISAFTSAALANHPDKPLFVGSVRQAASWLAREGYRCVLGANGLWTK